MTISTRVTVRCSFVMGILDAVLGLPGAVDAVSDLILDVANQGVASFGVGFLRGHQGPVM